MNEQNSGGQHTAKPGLTPVTELLKGAWELYQKHFSTLVPIMLVAGIGLYLQGIFSYLGADELSKSLMVGGDGASLDYAVTAGSMGMYGILALISSVIYLIGMIWGIAAILNKIMKLDQPMTLGQAFTNAKPLIWPLFLTGLLAGIFTILGLILLIIPGIIIGVWVSFSLFIVAEEKKSGMDALKASKAYVEGHWLAVFGRLIVIGLVIGIVASIIGKIGGMILGYQLGMLVQNIASLVLTPLALLYEYALYKNVRSLKGGSAPVATPAPAPTTTA